MLIFFIKFLLILFSPKTNYISFITTFNLIIKETLKKVDTR